MEVGVRTGVVVVAISLVAGALVQKQWDNKVVTSQKSTDSTVTKNHIVTVVREVKKPDGTTETDTTTTDESVKKEIEKQIVASSSPSKDPSWLISAGTGLNVERVQGYQLQVQRRILGPIWLGAYGSTRKEVGISIGVLF